MSTSFYCKTIDQSLQELATDAALGLSAEEAKARLFRDGANRLKTAKKKSLILRILAQFKDFLVIILLAAAVVSTLAEIQDGFSGLSDLKDALIILAILLLNVVIGITQENKADNALKELKKLSSPKAKVKRDGHLETIDSSDVVCGDIVVLGAGDYIPADIRIIESVNLKVDESSLTGESAPVEKDARLVIQGEASLGDRKNCAAMGTVVTYGRGTGVVYATGMNTEMGRIATILNETEETATPLQGKLNAMAKTLGIVCIAICAFIFAIGFLYDILNIGQQRGIIELFMVAVSLAVAAVPEGVAIVATVILAIGVHKMVKSNAIVKKLRAVETLGSTTVICSDKTGTLTQNKMTVVKVFDTENVYNVTGTGYSLNGEVVLNGREMTANIPLMAEIASLCNDAVYDPDNESIIGDPTEASMLVFAAKLTKDALALNEQHTRIKEIPFDSDRKLMSTFNSKNGAIVMNTKGAPDAIIKRSTRVYVNGSIVPMTETMRQSLIEQNNAFAHEALRVLAVAYKEYQSESDIAQIDNHIDETENNLIYVGMMCIIDPPREEVKGAVQQCRTAGITVKMITGDHKITASAIAKTLGIMKDGDEALDGNDIDNLSDEALQEKTKTVNVFARVSPEHKVRIVTAVKGNNNIVAMTGDGVNDAPSLKKADIGIAMGITGTDVSKEAADMILADDNFVSIVGAVEEGRTIYSNIRKVTSYLLSCNIGEILIILLAIVFGLPVPLLATQLLFVNLLTDALPAFALGMEGKETGIMSKRPRDPNEPIINKTMRSSIAFRSLFVGAAALGAFLCGLAMYHYEVAISLCFFTLVAAELLVAYPSRTETFSGLRRLVCANRFLNISILISLTILAAVMYLPPLNEVFSTVPLNAAQLGIGAAFILLAVFGSELSKRLFTKLR